MIKNKQKKFISIIWGYPKNMHSFSPEENYHLHSLKTAKEIGFKPYAIVMGNKENMINDPNFDRSIIVIDYKNPFHFFWRVLKFSFQNSLFYVNSYEWQSFIIPFIARRTIFMAHTQPQRQTKLKQTIQNFVYKFFTAIRLNNEEEKEFLLKQGLSSKKLFVIPLVVSQNIFKIIKQEKERVDLVYFGNVTKHKNLLTILKAFKKVLETKKELKLNIIGEIFDDTFKDNIKKLDLEKNILIHGHMIQNEQLTELLNTFLISINSSISEGQCIAIYDTALCGNALCLPNIMSFKGVFKESALFHDIFDSNKLAENIIYYLNSPNIIEQYKFKNIEKIKREYSKENIDNKLKDLIYSIC